MKLSLMLKSPEANCFTFSTMKGNFLQCTVQLVLFQVGPHFGITVDVDTWLLPMQHLPAPP